MKKNKFKILILLITALVTTQCSSYDKDKYIKNKTIIKDASENQKLVSLRFQNYPNNETDSLNVGLVKVIDSINGIFIFTNFLLERKNEFSIKKHIDSVSIIDDNEKIKLYLSDNSILFGSISMVDHENKYIIFKTPHKKYSVPKLKISKMNYDANYVKVIFQDGSEIFGTITKEDGDNILLSTTLGNETYQRSDILRIDYVK